MSFRLDSPQFENNSKIQLSQEIVADMKNMRIIEDWANKSEGDII